MEKTKTTIKEDKTCPEHKKTYIYNFSGIKYCVDCLDKIFKDWYTLYKNFNDIGNLD